MNPVLGSLVAENMKRALSVEIARLHELSNGLPEVVVVVLSGTDLAVSDADILAAGGRIDAAKEAWLNELVDELLGVDVFIDNTDIGNMDASYSVRTNWKGEKVLVISGGYVKLGTGMTSAQLTFDANGKLQGGYSWERPLNCSIAEEPTTSAALVSYYDRMTSALSGVVGTLTIEAPNMMAALMSTTPPSNVPSGFKNDGVAVWGCCVAACSLGSLVSGCDAASCRDGHSSDQLWGSTQLALAWFHHTKRSNADTALSQPARCPHRHRRTAYSRS